MKNIQLTLTAILIAVLFYSCADDTNPLTQSKDLKQAKDTILIYSRLGLIDSVLAISGISENSSVTPLAQLDFTGANKLIIKYLYHTSFLPGIQANDIALFSEPNNLYHSGSLPQSTGYDTIIHTIDTNPLINSELNLRLTVFYACQVLSIRDLQIFKFSSQ